MKSILKLTSAFAILAAVTAQDLDKPALTDDLDYLLAGNEANLPSSSHTISSWTSGTLPSDCKILAENEDKALSEIEVFDVQYEDCSKSWVFCRHKDAESSIETAAETFGKVPVGIRDWTKHVILFPGRDDGLGAYNDRNGNIVFFGERNLNVYIHEAAHSLDVLKGFNGVETNQNPTYLSAYAVDSHVPDNYAASTHLENTAQNTVIGVYDLNVPGGFPGIQPEYYKIVHQHSAIKQIYGDALKSGGKCGSRLGDSETVNLKSRKRGLFEAEGVAKRVSGMRRGMSGDRF
ncbi:hypothetical protein BJX70DRAFT_395228 [Aspergillus crustosus]